ncbi:MAG: hypothetical protein ACRDZM_10485, partial [Acidimicrobiia bacterium]
MATGEHGGGRRVPLNPGIRNVILGLGVVAGVLLGVPSVALAHGIGGRLDLPVPVTFFITGAGVALVVSFVALAVLWPEPRLQDGPRHEAARFSVPRGGVLSALGVLGLLLVIGQLLPPLLGLEMVGGRPTIAPVLVWVVFWLVVPFVGAIAGDWYTDINPWRALGRVLRVGTGERLWLPERVGIWPAGLLLFGLTWLELVNPDSGSPIVLGSAALAYT